MYSTGILLLHKRKDKDVAKERETQRQKETKPAREIAEKGMPGDRLTQPGRPAPRASCLLHLTVSSLCTLTRGGLRAAMELSGGPGARAMGGSIMGGPGGPGRGGPTRAWCGGRRAIGRGPPAAGERDSVRVLAGESRGLETVTWQG